jgi:hypothetical protein
VAGDRFADDEDAFDHANARIAVAHHALRRAEAALEAARAHVPEYALLEAAERDLASADAAYWHDGESIALLAPRLAARAAVSAARRAYHGVRESLPEYQEMIGAEADLASAVQARDTAWPPFSRTAARRDRVVAATDDH